MGVNNRWWGSKEQLHKAQSLDHLIILSDCVGPRSIAHASDVCYCWLLLDTGVAHFKTTFELAGPAAKLLSSLSPSQLSFVVEGLGAGGAKDLELFSKVADQVG